MGLENPRQQEPGNNDPSQGNRWFRFAIIVLSALAVIGALIFLSIILGFCAPNRSTTPNPTARAPATAVVIVETQAPPTAAPATATLILAPTASETTANTNTQPTHAPPAATAPAAQPTAAPATEPSATVQPTRSTIAPQAAETKERPGALGRLYIGALRYEPPNPVRNEPVSFYVTMLNRTGKAQIYPLCVEIYLSDKAKPLGTTDCNNVTIPNGASEVPVGFWIGTGIKQCIPLRARAVMRAQGGEERIALTNVQGEQLWTDLAVCP